MDTEAFDQAALKSVKKRRVIVLVLALSFLVVSLGFCLRYGFYLCLADLGAIYLLWDIYAIWIFIELVVGFAFLGREKKELQNGGEPPKTGWKSKSRGYRVNSLLQAALLVVLLCLTARSCSASILVEDRVSLFDYTGTQPFATMQDIADDSGIDYSIETVGEGGNINTFRRWSTLFCPSCIEYAQMADVTFADGRQFHGSLIVNYYECKSPSLAQHLADELYAKAQRDKNFESLEPPLSDAAFAVTYTNELGLETLLARDGTRLVRAVFIQSSDDGYKVAFADWSRVMASSILGG